MAINAVCIFMGAVLGEILLTQKDINKAEIHIQGKLLKLEPGDHGFHVHQYGDLRNKCVNASSHYNPFNKDHGSPEDEDRHVGDWGNIVANSEGEAIINQNFAGAQLHGEHSILGRAIVVHALKDDLGRGGNEESKKTGNAGARLDCCVIGLTKSD